MNSLTLQSLDSSSADELFELLGQELGRRLSAPRNSPEFLHQLQQLPAGLRAMAATYELDVSLALDLTTSSAALTKALRLLAEPHREVLILRYYENLRIHEIAAQLEISPGTVKSRLHYALAEMQKLLPAEMNLFGATGTEKKETV